MSKTSYAHLSTLYGDCIMQEDKIKNIPLGLALLPILCLVTLFSSSYYLFGNDSSSGPNQIALLFSAGIIMLIGLKLGISYKELEDAIIDSISRAMGAVLILLMVGALIGTWMMAGTAPAMIYHGLSILDPAWFYPATMIICALVSLTIGSSWTTAGTVGIALVGIASVLGLSPAITAGAVISGAYFGDKLSPLSDTTNLAPAMAGTDLFTHIRHMFWTTAPSFVIALILFSFLGSNSEGVASMASIEENRTLLASNYNLGWPTFIPLVLLLTLTIKKVPAFPAIAAGALAGCIIAVTYQSDGVVKFIDPQGTLTTTLALIKGAWQALVGGYVADTGNKELNDLLSRGGMASMLNTIWLVVSAMSFGGVMEKTGLLQRITMSLVGAVKGTASLIVTTALTAIGTNLVTSDQYMAIVLPGRMFRMEFARRGLAPENLSRTIEDAGTMTSPLIPWNACGAFMATTLGVPTLAYLPYAFINLMNPIIAIIYGIFNIKITKLSEEEISAALSTQAGLTTR